MEIERILAQFASETRYEDLPKETLEIIKDVLLTVLGTTIAGAKAEGWADHRPDLLDASLGPGQAVTAKLDGGVLPHG